MDMNLPDMCFSFLVSNDPGKQVVAIQRGERGFSLTTYDETDPAKAQALVNHMNKKLGVTEAQAECMLAGSMFGWEVPGAQLGVSAVRRPINKNMEKFFRLLGLAGAITIDDGALLTDGSEIEKITGDPENEVVRFSWTDGECDYSDILTEGGIAEGVFHGDGKFVCENKDGDKTVFHFFALELLGAERPVVQELAYKLEELNTAYEAATPGEWGISRHATPDYAPQFGVYADGASNDLAIVRGEANTNFIALAHNTMPLLLEAMKTHVMQPDKTSGLDGAPAAKLFFDELLDSVETLTGIADEHGARTLADLMYLQNAIMKNGFVDHYPGESKVLEIASALPSGDRWTKFVKVEQSLDTADTNKSKLEIEPTKIIVVLEGGIVQSVLAAKSGVSVAVIDYDKNASWDDLIEIPQDGGKKATAFAAIHEPEVIDQARITELYTAVSRNVSISEMSASLTDAATIATQKESYTVADPSVDRRHEGKVLGVTNQHVVLSIGRAAVVLAQEDIDKVPAIGDDVVVKFAGGKGSVELVKGKEVDQGR